MIRRLIVSVSAASLAFVSCAIGDVTTDSNGWHVNTPSVDSTVVYVDPVGGNNSNSGLSSSAPKKTLLGSGGAWGLITSGDPDHLYFKTGTTCTENFPTLNKSGRSATEPLVIGAYGDLSLGRPVISGFDATNSNIVVYIATGSQNPSIQHVWVRDIAFLPPAGGGYNIAVYGATIHDINFEGCEFSNRGVLFTAEPSPSASYDNWNFYRNIFRNADAGDASHHIGVYINGCTNLSFYENVFFNNGMGPLQSNGRFGAGATIYNHNCYFKPTTTGAVFVRNLSIAGASHGVQMRGGGLCEDNIFSHNGIGIMMGGGNDDHDELPGGSTGVVRGNAVLRGRYINSVNAYGWAMEFKNSNASGYLVEDNIISSALEMYQDVSIEFDGEHGALRNVTFQDNVQSNWPGNLFFNNGGSQSGHIVRRNVFQDSGGAFSSNANTTLVDLYTSSTAMCTFTDNEYYDQGSPNAWYVAGNRVGLTQWKSLTGETGATFAQHSFPDASRTCETYAATKGLSSTIQAFAQAAMDRVRRDRWDGTFTATDVLSYLRVGFGLDSPPLGDAPPAPATVSASALEEAVAVSWSAVTEADSYKVYHRTVGGSWSAGTPDTASPLIVSSLTADTVYEFAVTSVNTNGESAFSTIATATPFPLPTTAPQNVTATAQSSAVLVSWDSVASADDYSVYYRASGAPTYALSASGLATTSRVVSGLTPGTLYEFVVSASNSSGEGPISDVATATPLSNAPGVPTGVSVTPGIQQISVSWTAVSGATSYNVQYRVVGAPSWGASQSDTDPPFVIAGLSAGTNYEARVSAVNSGGESAFSSSASGVPLPPIPSAPTGVSATPGPEVISVSWSSVSGATSYMVYVRVQGAGSWPAGISAVTSPLNVVGATAGTTYECAVSAVNASGESSMSSTVTAVPLPQIPSVPSSVVATGGELECSVSWASSSGATSYNVIHRLVGTSVWSAPDSSASSPFLVTPLAAGQWQFAVSAVNSGGESSYSSPVSATVRDVESIDPPDKPLGVLYRINGAQSVSIKWDAVPGATSYAVRYGKSASDLDNEIPTTLTIVTIGGLTRGERIYASVWAIKEGVYSEQSAIVSAVPQRRRRSTWQKRRASGRGRRRALVIARSNGARR